MPRSTSVASERTMAELFSTWGWQGARGTGGTGLSFVRGLGHASHSHDRHALLVPCTLTSAQSSLSKEMDSASTSLVPGAWSRVPQRTQLVPHLHGRCGCDCHNARVGHGRGSEPVHQGGPGRRRVRVRQRDAGLGPLGRGLLIGPRLLEGKGPGIHAVQGSHCRRTGPAGAPLATLSPQLACPPPQPVLPLSLSPYSACPPTQPVHPLCTSPHWARRTVAPAE